MTRRGFFGLLIGAAAVPRLAVVKTQGEYKLVKGYRFIATDDNRLLGYSGARLHVWDGVTRRKGNNG